jgi:SAM-dependent methyltransferase
MNFFKSINSIYNKLSNFGKLLLLVTIFLIVVVILKAILSGVRKNQEGYAQNDSFLFKEGVKIYDDFYADIYDHLVFNNMKDDFEIGEIKNKTSPSSQSVILDVGSGTGHHVASLAKDNLKVIGIDISPSMVAKAKFNFPDYDFKVGDALDYSQFNNDTFTHITCLYFTVYYFEDKRKFFSNCYDWLMSGGTLIIHVVDREKFDPILPPGNPLYVVSPQRYAKERITKTKITFTDFVYSSDFETDLSRNISTFHEKFKFNDGKVRKQEHTLFMEPESDIITMAQNAGFIVGEKIDMMGCAYDNQYLYVLIKPQ